MNGPNRLALFDSLQESSSNARIESLNRETAKSDVATWWDDLSETLRPVADEPDIRWDWVALISRDRNKPNRRAVCVRTDDGLVQGAMTYNLAGKSILVLDQGAVYVDRLATAPRNRTTLFEDARYRGVGVALLTFAVAESFAYGLKGRVILYPIANLSFYENRGFVETNEMSQEGDVVYELPEDAATVLLKSRGLL